MSKKSFIITALVINLTICLTMCVVLFTDKDRADRSNSENNTITDTKDNETTKPIPIIQDSENSNTNHNTVNDSQEMSGHDTTYNETLKGETTKVMESQVSSDTQPITYNNNETTTTGTSENETTGSSIKGTTATINSSCNIRSSADVTGNVIGTANAGTIYKIDNAKCNNNWIAVILESGQIGYVAESYCHIQ